MTLMETHHSEMDTLPTAQFSNMRCKDMYSTMAANNVHVPQTKYTTWEGPQHLLH